MYNFSYKGKQSKFKRIKRFVFHVPYPLTFFYSVFINKFLNFISMIGFAKGIHLFL